MNPSVLVQVPPPYEAFLNSIKGLIHLSVLNIDAGGIDTKAQLVCVGDASSFNEMAVSGSLGMSTG